MNDFRNIALIAKRVASIKDSKTQLQVAKHLESLLRSAIVSLKIKIREENGR